MRAALAAVALAACGGPAGTPAPSSPPSLDDLAWMVGDWKVGDVGAAEHWMRAPTAIWGVSLDDHGFEVMVIDLGGDGGELRLTPSPDGDRSVSFTRTGGGATSVTFTNPAHDDPTSIGYRREGERLVARLDGPEGERLWPMTAISPAAPASDEVLAAAAARHPRAVAPRASWRSLPHGRVAATLTVEGDTSEVIVWRPSGADARWAPAYEDRHP